ncbi:MAG: GNAT family N-acetyltransferase [Lishizhenia sp.]
MLTVPVIETKRLRIRPHTLKDLSSYAEMQANPRVMEMIPADLMTYNESKLFLQGILASYENPKREKLILAVEIKQDAVFIGNCAIIYLRKDPEIGYRLKEKFWNKGYATEISKALIEHIFQSTKHTKIIADCAVNNIGSSKVLHKFFKNIGTSFNTKDNCQDYHFELLKKNWAQ